MAAHLLPASALLLPFEHATIQNLLIPSGDLSVGSLSVNGIPPCISLGTLIYGKRVLHRGIVILVKKGNPKNIRSVWDLGRSDINLVTPNAKFEPGVFTVYSESVYNIASNDPNPPAQMNADKLFNQMFNGVSSNANKWLQGARIHHRDEPWSVAFGRADAAVIYYHLGLFSKQTFPDTFDITPLGGTIDNPDPLAGTLITERYIVALKGNWNRRQSEAQQTLINTLRSEQFAHILEKRGLRRPDGFIPAEFTQQVQLSSK